MNKLFFLILASFFLICSCEKKTSESNALDSNVVDSLTKDSVIVEPEAQLTGKSAMVAKNWKALEFETPTAKLTSDLVDITFNFKSNGDFEYSEDGKKEKGKWKANEGETMIMLQYDDNSKADYNIKELKDDRMVLTGKVHGMYRTYVLAPK